MAKQKKYILFQVTKKYSCFKKVNWKEKSSFFLFWFCIKMSGEKQILPCETLHCIIYRKHMDPFAILYIRAWLDRHHI